IAPLTRMLGVTEVGRHLGLQCPLHEPLRQLRQQALITAYLSRLRALQQAVQEFVDLLVRLLRHGTSIVGVLYHGHLHSYLDSPTAGDLRPNVRGSLGPRSPGKPTPTPQLH